MTIDVKIFNRSGLINTQTIDSNNPDDPTLIAILGGNEESDLKLLGVHNGWDVLTLTNSNQEILIIGVSPTMGVPPEERKSCNLSHLEIHGLLDYLEVK